MHLALCNSKIAFDTNMLLAMIRFRVDVFNAIREKLGSGVLLAVPEKVPQELEKIAERDKKSAMEVKIALGLLEKNGVKKIETLAGNADDALLELSQKGFCIATNDRALRKRIKMLGGKNIYLRKKKLIEIE